LTMAGCYEQWDAALTNGGHRRILKGRIMANKTVAPLPIDPLSYSIEQLSAQTGLGRTKIYEEINAGRLRAIKIGKRRLIPHTDAAAWIETYRAGAGR
jgi:excisionase family DNA binding protein